MIERHARLRILFVALLAYATSTAAVISDPTPPPPFQAHVDMKTFMEHVLTPAATIIWRVNGIVIDEKGEHDLSPQSDADWESVVSGAATLAEATNALMIPGRARDAEWNSYVQELSAAADKSYQAAEAHDYKSVSDVSDRLDGICADCHRHYGLE
jgi:cytochrome c556